MLCSLSREDAPEKRGLIEGEMTRNALQFIRSGHRVRIEQFAPRATLLDWLRLEERSTGTKEGCAEGDCGACAVVLARERDGRLVHESVNSCITLLGQIDGAELITVEDLAENGALHPVQEAMARLHGSQCGFCTPGIVMSLFAHYHSCDGRTSRDTINDVLAGNLCRCTGYRPIVDSAVEVCKTGADDQFTRKAAARLQTLRALDDKADVFVGDETSFFAAPASEQSFAQLYMKHPDATIVAGATDVGLWITKKLTPDAVTRNVISAASRPSAALTAPINAPPNAPRRARPAITQPLPRTPAASQRSIPSAKCMVGTSCAISCWPAIGAQPSAT